MWKVRETWCNPTKVAVCGPQGFQFSSLNVSVFHSFSVFSSPEPGFTSFFSLERHVFFRASFPAYPSQFFFLCWTFHQAGEVSPHGIRSPKFCCFWRHSSSARKCSLRIMCFLSIMKKTEEESILCTKSTQSFFPRKSMISVLLLICPLLSRGESGGLHVSFAREESFRVGFASF